MRASRRKRRHVPELNLVPLLDMMSLLIQVLLINVHFGTYAQIATRAGGKTGAEPTGGLVLDVGIDESGFSVAWTADGRRMSRAFACPSVPCATEGYPAAELRDMLEKLKVTAPDENKVVLSPKGAVAFEVMALTMDAVRVDRGNQPLFPEIVMADGR